MPIEDIKPALDKLRTNALKYQEFYDYFDGKHQINFASDKFKNKFGKRLQKLRENLCKTVVKAPASRLEIIGFQKDKKDVQKKAWEIWKRNKMPRVSGEVHREAFKTGDAYVIVWTDKQGKAKYHANLARNVAVWTNSETGETEKAVKAWKGNDGYYYLNLYYRDSVEKYKTKRKSSILPSTQNAFELRIIGNEQNPLPHKFGRVPVFHFKYDAEMADCGTSLLADVIPINDALNKSWADIMGAQEENMRRRRFVAGMQVEVDEETGKKINPFKPDDDILFADESETKFGEFSDANLTEMIAVKQEAVKDIALVSGIPPSYFNLESVGSAISGEALRKLEARFTAIVQEAQRSFGETWAEVENLGLYIDAVGTPDVAEIETQWTDAAPVSETEQLDNGLKKKNLGWSEQQIQRDMGVSDEQIKQMADENATREQEKLDRQMKAFDAGDSLVE